MLIACVRCILQCRCLCCGLRFWSSVSGCLSLVNPLLTRSKHFLRLFACARPIWCWKGPAVCMVYSRVGRCLASRTAQSTNVAVVINRNWTICVRDALTAPFGVKERRICCRVRPNAVLPRVAARPQPLPRGPRVLRIVAALLRRRKVAASVDDISPCRCRRRQRHCCVALRCPICSGPWTGDWQINQAVRPGRVALWSQPQYKRPAIHVLHTIAVHI